MDAVVDLIFLIDIIIMFRTTYLDTKMSEEVYDPHKIAIRYIKGRLVIDILSSVPFAEFFSRDNAYSGYLDMLGLLKLIRLTRV